ncbi:MAG TPA: fused MFS/spermidine synthase [Planctomycetota bacterium]|nr:fused MFS/spermidine synthase [Planctomycetota bacterium]
MERPSGRDRALLVAYLLSGGAALIYQVVWARALALRFGSDVVATSIVLAVFMGGLALGGWIGAPVADRAKRPLVIYGLLELAVGVCGLLIEPLLGAADPILRSAYQGWFETARLRYECVRVGIAALALLPPTTLMGMTLPLVIRHVVRDKDSLGHLGARFYAVNTLGALLGTLASGFVLVPALGVRATTLVAASGNLIAALTSLALGAGPGSVREVATVSVARESGAKGGGNVLLAIGVSGCAALALEVLWTRALLLSFGATVYSFAIMLACFLFGISFGSIVAGRVVDRVPSAALLLAKLELALGVVVALLLLVLEVVPPVFGGLFLSLAKLGQGSFAVSLVLAPLLVSFVVLALPTSLLGATFPAAVRAYGDAIGRPGAAVGRVSAANTLGAILGAAGAGFVLVPVLHTKAALAAVAAAFVVNGLYLGFGKLSGRLLAGACALVLAFAGTDLLIPYRPVLNYNQREASGAKVVYHAEGPSATIDLLQSPSAEMNGRDATSLVIGGNIEADNSPTQMRHFILKAHLPLLYLEHPRDVLVVGLGMGLTLHSSLGHPGVEHIQVVELSPEIRDAHAYLKDVNQDAIHDPKVSVRIDDGRNYLKFADAHYDMITADPIHPKVTGVGYLYTTEYYRSIKEHLRPGGVVCQWMPIYQMSPRSLRSAFKSFLEVFPQGTFWYVKNHGLFVARDGEPTIDAALLMKKLADENVRRDLASIHASTPEELLSLLLLGPEEARAYVNGDASAPLNTDDFPYLEYQCPREIFFRPRQNVEELVRYARPRADLVRGLDPAIVARFEEAVKGRNERLVGELGER